MLWIQCRVLKTWQRYRRKFSVLRVLCSSSGHSYTGVNPVLWSVPRFQRLLMLSAAFVKEMDAFLFFS